MDEYGPSSVAKCIEYFIIDKINNCSRSRSNTTKGEYGSGECRLPIARSGIARGGLGPLNFTNELWFLYFTAFVIKRVKPIRSNAYPATTMSIFSNSTAAVLFGPRDIRIMERRVYTPTPGHVQVEIVSTGLCGSDRMPPLSLSFFL
jgi:hypothetical protein